MTKLGLRMWRARGTPNVHPNNAVVTQYFYYFPRRSAGGQYIINHCNMGALQ